MQEFPLLDLVIVGAQKAFTTSLKNYLGEHPSILSHPQQEMAYFMSEREFAAGYKNTLEHYYKNEWIKGKKKLLAKNAILYTSEIGIKRLAEHNPHAKLVFNLRNPTDRAYSAYLMEYNYADIMFPFKKIKDIAEKADTSYWPFNLFIDAGSYAKQLKIIYKYFPKEQVKIVLFEDIKSDTLAVCKDIFQWLGVDENFKPEIKIYNPTMQRRSKAYASFIVKLLKKNSLTRKTAKLLVPEYYNHKIGNLVRNLNKTKQTYDKMDDETRKFLLNYYAGSNKELSGLIGRDVATMWNK